MGWLLYMPPPRCRYHAGTEHRQYRQAGLMQWHRSLLLLREPHYARATEELTQIKQKMTYTYIDFKDEQTLLYAATDYILHFAQIINLMMILDDADMKEAIRYARRCLYAAIAPTRIFRRLLCYRLTRAYSTAMQHAPPRHGITYEVISHLLYGFTSANSDFLALDSLHIVY